MKGTGTIQAVRRLPYGSSSLRTPSMITFSAVSVVGEMVIS
jgi:hypothetical protein